MAFLKALTVFIVCISIFRVVISKSTIVGNEDNSTDYNVLLDGWLKCKPCGGTEVTIVLWEKKEIETKYMKNCNSRFFITRNLTSPTREDYKATFAYICQMKVEKMITKPAKFVSNIPGLWYYTFGTINFETTKKRRNRKRRNGFRKNNF
uniref:Uncharacterized protein n=1 Tax=Strongyloides papillosus TaxID=174720 RepID=A0A0N5C076_STREA